MHEDNPITKRIYLEGEATIFELSLPLQRMGRRDLIVK